MEMTQWVCICVCPGWCKPSIATAIAHSGNPARSGLLWCKTSLSFTQRVRIEVLIEGAGCLSLFKLLCNGISRLPCPEWSPAWQMPLFPISKDEVPICSLIIYENHWLAFLLAFKVVHNDIKYKSNPMKINSSLDAPRWCKNTPPFLIQRRMLQGFLPKEKTRKREW